MQSRFRYQYAATYAQTWNLGAGNAFICKSSRYSEQIGSFLDRVDEPTRFVVAHRSCPSPSRWRSSDGSRARNSSTLATLAHARAGATLPPGRHAVAEMAER